MKKLKGFGRYLPLFVRSWHRISPWNLAATSLIISFSVSRMFMPKSWPQWKIAECVWTMWLAFILNDIWNQLRRYHRLRGLRLKCEYWIEMMSKGAAEMSRTGIYGDVDQLMNQFNQYRAEADKAVTEYKQATDRCFYDDKPKPTTKV